MSAGIASIASVNSAPVGSVPLRSDMQSDSLTMTLKWELMKSTREIDDIAGFAILDGKSCVAYNYTATQMSKFNDSNPLRVKLLPGKYDVIVKFKTKTDSCSGFQKFIVKEGIEMSRDTTLLFKGSEATKRFRFKYYLPDGKLAKVKCYKTSKEIDYTGVNTYIYSMAQTMLNKNVPEWNWSMSYAIKEERPYMKWIDQMATTDIKVNPGVSDKYVVTQSGYINPMDTVTHERDAKQFISFLSFEVPMSAEAQTFSNSYKEYKQICFGKVKRSLNKEENMALANDFYTHGYKSGFINVVGVASKELKANYWRMKGELPGLQFYPMTLESKTKIKLQASDGNGIVLPQTDVLEDGDILYRMNHNVGDGLKDIVTDQSGVLDLWDIEPHPVYTYKASEQKPDFGNSAPVLSFPLLTTSTVSKYFTIPNGNFVQPQWIANFGERRSIDTNNMKFVMLADNDTLTTSFSGFTAAVKNHFSTDHTPHILKMIFDNRNFTVDSIPGRTYAEVSIKESRDGDVWPPTMQMMQLRDKDGQITNRFENPSNGQLNFSYGDFNQTPCVPNNKQQYFACAEADLKVEVAPRGSADFKEISYSVLPEYFKMPVWGYFGRAGLEQISSKSPDGWFDIRFSLTDKTGNTQIQTVSPAFYIKNLDSSGVNEMIVDADSQAKLIGIYDITGRQLSRSVNGINIFRYSDGSSRKVIIRK